MASMQIDQPLTLLGGLSPQQFMRQYWHKKPFVVRGAIPNFSPPLDAPSLRRLAQDDQVESRLIRQQEGQWTLRHGPFKKLPASVQPNWTVLLQGINTLDERSAQLLEAFRFVPEARLDDLMVSLAGPGGGVGPHFDSYDVFLLQGHGQRRWRYGRAKDLRLRDDMPVKILRQFAPEHEVTLQPGDMLYLPPHWAHDGVALDGPCTTWSIGFRAPTEAELLHGLLDDLATHPPKGRAKRYADPKQVATQTPAEIPDALIAICRRSLEQLVLDDERIADFLGRSLSEPKPHVFFEPPTEAPELRAGPWPVTLQLDRRSRMLRAGLVCYINGERIEQPSNPWLQQLADQRAVTITASEWRRLPRRLKELFQTWLEDGYLRRDLPRTACKD